MINILDKNDITEFCKTRSVTPTFSDETDSVIISTGVSGRPKEQIIVKTYKDYSLVLSFRHVVGHGEYSYFVNRIG